MSDDFNLDISNFDIDFSGQSGLGSSDPVHEILALLEEEKTGEALDMVEAYRATAGATPLVRHLLALTILRLGRLLPALKVMQTAHDDLPEAYEHAEVLSVLYSSVGKHTDGVFYAKLSTALKPYYPQYKLVPSWMMSAGTAFLATEENPLVDYGYGFLEIGQVENATSSFLDAIELDKDNASAWRGLIEAKRRTGQVGYRLKAIEALVALEDHTAQDWLLYARCLVEAGKIEDAWAAAQSALQEAQQDPVSVAHCLPGLVRYDETVSPDRAVALSQSWNTLADLPVEAVNVTQRVSQDALFRVGIISGSMHIASERAPFLSTIEECLSRAAHIYFYANIKEEDSISRRMRRGAAAWRNIYHVDDETAATMIRNDEIQILIDLDGFDWSGRPGIVKRMPAPVVLCAFGAPDCIPGADQGALALGEPDFPLYSAADGHVQMPTGLSTWPLYEDLEEDVPNSTVTGAMRVLIDASLARLSDSVLACLADAVKQGFHGTLVLYGDQANDEVANDVLRDRFAHAGLNLDTVERISEKAAIDDVIDGVDVVLDTFPLPSVEIALTALRHGVPVLTVQPARPENAAVVSLLRSLGLHRWVQQDRPRLAQELARLSQDPQTLRSSRQALAKSAVEAGAIGTIIQRAREFAGLFDQLLAKAAGQE
jgi:predicted O-linked N-acetylglucosamine transferase (SPINDLY family)